MLQTYLETYVLKHDSYFDVDGEIDLFAKIKITRKK